METLLAHCSDWYRAEYPLALSIALAGLVGSASHCSFMCSPAVAAQMLELRNHGKAQSWVGYYHAGRLTTYMVLGGVAQRAGHLIFGGALDVATSILLVVAGLVFLASAIMPTQTHHCCGEKKQNMLAWVGRHFYGRSQYFIRGLLMGLMPCGMMISILLLVSTSSSPLAAAGMMLLFGLTTLPALQLAALGVVTLGRDHPALGRTVMAANGIALCGIGFGLVSLH